MPKPPVQERCLTNVALVSCHVLVSAQVGSKTMPGGAPLLAGVALVIFLSCMYDTVRRKVAKTRKRLVALLTFVRRFFRGVRLAVGVELLPGGVLLAAETASVHLGVPAKMSVEIAPCHKLSATFGTFEFLSRVPSKVLRQFVFPTKRLAAVGARVRPTGTPTARSSSDWGGMRSRLLHQAVPRTSGRTRRALECRSEERSFVPRRSVNGGIHCRTRRRSSAGDCSAFHSVGRVFGDSSRRQINPEFN